MKKVIWVISLVIGLTIIVPLIGYAGDSRVHVGVNIGAGHPALGVTPTHSGGHVGYRGTPSHWKVHTGWYSSSWRGPIIVRTYPYYAPIYPPVVIAQEPPLYVQPEPENYLYYCSDPQGYYPDVQSCPGRWMKVIP